MRRFLTGAASAAAIGICLTVPVCAATIDQDSDPKEAITTLTTSREATYTVVIPEQAGILFDKENNSIGSICYQSGNLEPDAYVTVSLSEQTPLENQADTSYTIPYEVRDADGVFKSAVYTEDTENKTETPLVVHISKEAWEKAKSGDYSAKLTFTIEYTNPHAKSQP